MKTITLKKVEIEHFEILQCIAFQSKNSAWDIRMGTNNYSDAYFNSLITIDVANNLILRFRNKIENQNLKFSSIKLKIHEAIILLQCCNNFKEFNPLQKVIAMKVGNEIHKQLINL